MLIAGKNGPDPQCGRRRRALRAARRQQDGRPGLRDREHAGSAAGVRCRRMHPLEHHRLRSVSHHTGNLGGLRPVDAVGLMAGTMMMMAVRAGGWRRSAARV
jgi:hypothetical protein